MKKDGGSLVANVQKPSTRWSEASIHAEVYPEMQTQK